MGKKVLKSITSLLLITSITSASVMASNLKPDAKYLLKLKLNELESLETKPKHYNFDGNLLRIQILLIDDNKKNKNMLIIDEPEDLYSLLGMTEDEYIKALSKGHSLKSLLETSGKTEKYKDMLLNNYVMTLEVAVTKGSITSEESHRLLASYKDFLSKNDFFAHNEEIYNSKHNDPVLDMLDMSLSEYKHQLNKGESLTSLINKANKVDDFKAYNLKEYKKIIDTAVNSGSLTSTEGENLVKFFA